MIAKVYRKAFLFTSKFYANFKAKASLFKVGIKQLINN